MNFYKQWKLNKLKRKLVILEAEKNALVEYNHYSSLIVKCKKKIAAIAFDITRLEEEPCNK